MTDTPKPDTSVETVELAQRAAIRAALEAAEEACRDKAAELSTKRPDGRAQHFMGAQVGALSCADSIRKLSPDDILKRL